MSSLTQSPAWLALQEHQSLMAQQPMRDLFHHDSQRFEKFSIIFNDILMDYAQPADEEMVWSVWEGNARVKR